MIVPSHSPPLQISGDFIVPNLSSPPVPLPEKLPKVIEKVEKKVESINLEHKETKEKREKTENTKLKEETAKPVSICAGKS